MLSRLFKRDPKIPVRLILLFGYHKCMTSYFSKVFSEISRLNNWYYKHHNGIVETFYDDVRNPRKISIVSVNNVYVNFQEINSDYRGCHIIRDPRDLLVSGFNYHKWCKEDWVCNPMEPWLREILRLNELEIPNRLRHSSLKEILQNVGKDIGYLLELNYRSSQFDQMMAWDYNNSFIFETRYEDIFGNEKQMFERIFRHFNFNQILIKNSLEIVKRHSFSHLKMIGQTGNNRHATKGVTGQWREEIPQNVLYEFERRHPLLLSHLGYQD